MSPGELLGIAAQIAVALAGFTGVVVVFGENSVAEWSAVDTLKLRLLVTFSATPLALCLIGLLLLATAFAEATIWCICSLLAFALAVPLSVNLARHYRAIPRGEFRSGGGSVAIFLTSNLFGIAVTLFQLVNAFALRQFWPYFLLIVGQLIGATVQFVRLVLFRPRANAPQK